MNLREPIVTRQSHTTAWRSFTWSQRSSWLANGSAACPDSPTTHSSQCSERRVTTNGEPVGGIL
ncbi:MAG TPA: hypothetical protein VGI60_03570 [Chthoniobacterales bacterium]